jgi:hypothetical protein
VKPNIVTISTLFVASYLDFGYKRYLIDYIRRNNVRATVRVLATFADQLEIIDKRIREARRRHASRPPKSASVPARTRILREDADEFNEQHFPHFVKEPSDADWERIFECVSSKRFRTEYAAFMLQYDVWRQTIDVR